MKRILSKDQVVSIVENFKFKVGDTIFIHHPITEDLISVRVKELKRDKILVSIPEDSPYLGQPDWFIPKVNIIGLKALKENQLNLGKQIPVIIKNWKEFQQNFNEWSTDDPANYKNPMEIWKDLCLHVSNEFNCTGKLPQNITICYKKYKSDNDAIFDFVPGTESKPTYEYTGTIS
jgi:hypothetical protein